MEKKNEKLETALKGITENQPKNEMESEVESEEDV